MWTIKDDLTPSVTTAEAITAHNLKGQNVTLPETAILFYMDSGIEYTARRYPCRLILDKLPRFLRGEPVWQLSEGVCFTDGGRGAPQAASTIETLRVLGVKNVFTIGLCGGFSDRVSAGDILVPRKAFVEEGSSLHYYESIEYAEPDPELFERLLTIPCARAADIVSTDAVFRQTYRKEALWREKGCVGVDMETSALLGIGKYLGMKVASVLMVSDVHPLYEGAPEWQWTMTPGLRETLFERALDVILR